jgi:phosphoketolase
MTQEVISDNFIMLRKVFNLRLPYFTAQTNTMNKDKARTFRSRNKIMCIVLSKKTG